MRKSIILFVALCLALALCACGGQAKEEDRVVKIGVFEPSTGNYASVGMKEILGIQYANVECPSVEIGGKTYEIQLILTDNRSGIETAAAAAEDLVDAGAAIVIGSYGSELSLAGAPAFEEAGVAAVGATCSDPAVTAGNSYYYSICFPDSLYADTLACFASEQLGAKNAYCLGTTGNMYGSELITRFTQSFEKAGGRVVTDFFPSGVTDFSGYLNKAVNEGAELIFAPVSTSSAAQIVTQAIEHEMELPVLGPDWIDDSQVLEAAAGSNVKLYVSTPYLSGISEQFDKGFQEYLDANSEAKVANGGSDAVSSVTALGYDAYYLAVKAMKLAGSVDKADILAKMPAVTFSGICGEFSFDADGDALRTNAFIKGSDNANGIWVLEKIQSGSGA